MEESRAYFFLKLARISSIWGLIYLGIGIGFALSELYLYGALQHITPMSFFALGAFFMALINYHVRQWACGKVGVLDEEGRQKKIDELRRK